MNNDVRRLSRRDFLRYTAAASGVVFAGGALASCGGAIGGGGGGGGGGSEEEALSKTIDFVVPTSPGGGFDTTARTILPYLEKNLPEGTSITVRNLPGGNYVPSVERVTNSKNNTIGLFNIPGELAAPITGQADYDLSKIEWIGLPAKGVYLAAASPASGIKTPEDMKKMSKIDVGVETITSTSSVGTQIGLNNLGLKQDKLNLVTHEGSSEAILAAVRGDVDFLQYPYPPLREYVVGSDDLTPLWVYAPKRFKDLPDVPTFEEVGGDPALIDVVTLYRPMGTGPNNSSKALKTLRDAMKKTMKNEELIKKMNDQELGPTYEGPEETAGIIERGTEQMTKYKSLLGG